MSRSKLEDGARTEVRRGIKRRVRELKDTGCILSINWQMGMEEREE